MIRNFRVLTPSLLRRSVHVEAKIEALGLKLPQPAVPKGSFVNFVVVDNLAYLSGHLPQVRPSSRTVRISLTSFFEQAC